MLACGIIIGKKTTTTTLGFITMLCYFEIGAAGAR